eukprot:gb/GEZN01017457.1/.p1 GENE.gb/GEZN01017457.1/~~gb/GEZN01017457.1/.p1  ORF type:complete len:135 (+),score=27.24 gb/GEZN01017457.1/:67-471(+)
MAIKLVPSHFKDFGKEGDFEWMIKQPKYANHFFIFQDTTAGAETRGKGADCVRGHERAYGIVVADPGRGFKELDEKKKAVIDAAVEHIRQVCKKKGYTCIQYPANDNGGFAASRFGELEKVSNYVTDRLKSISG